MNKIWVIAWKDISEAFHSRSTYLVILVMIFLTFVYISGYKSHIKLLTDQQDIDIYSQSIANNLVYMLPMMFSTFICSIFVNYAIIVDKAKHNIETLMATPVSIVQIWMGKSLAVTVPSLVIGYSVAILSYLIMAIGFMKPETNSFVSPSTLAIISALVIIPILIFVIVCIVVCIQLMITNPRIASFAFTGIFVLLLFGAVVVNYLALIYSGMIVLCIIANYFLSFHLTKERVLLSSKM